MTNEINNHGRKNRKRKKASGYYKIQPIFGDGDKETFTIGDVTHIIDGRLEGYLIVSVPETTTQGTALDQERQFAEVTKKPVLVIGHNVTCLRATLMTKKEVAELKKAVKEQDDARNPTE